MFARTFQDMKVIALLIVLATATQAKRLGTHHRRSLKTSKSSKGAPTAPAVVTTTPTDVASIIIGTPAPAECPCFSENDVVAMARFDLDVLVQGGDLSLLLGQTSAAVVVDDGVEYRCSYRDERRETGSHGFSRDEYEACCSHIAAYYCEQGFGVNQQQDCVDSLCLQQAALPNVFGTCQNSCGNANGTYTSFDVTHFAGCSCESGCWCDDSCCPDFADTCSSMTPSCPCYNGCHTDGSLILNAEDALFCWSREYTLWRSMLVNTLGKTLDEIEISWNNAGTFCRVHDPADQKSWTSTGFDEALCCLALMEEACKDAGYPTLQETPQCHDGVYCPCFSKQNIDNFVVLGIEHCALQQDYDATALVGGLDLEEDGLHTTQSNMGVRIEDNGERACTFPSGHTQKGLTNEEFGACFSLMDEACNSKGFRLNELPGI